MELQSDVNADSYTVLVFSLAMVSNADVQALRKELKQTHQQREELLLKVKVSTN